MGLSEEGRAVVGNVIRCGSVWACPVCGPKIRAERAEEIRAGLVHLTGALGGAVGFLTLTMPHTRSDSLGELMRLQARCFRTLLSGRAWQATRKAYGVLGTIRASDTTHGRNGWHPHLHVILCLERELSPAELQELERRLWDRWARALRSAGRKAPTREKGAQLEAARDAGALARYAAKAAAADDAAAPAELPELPAVELSLRGMPAAERTAAALGHELARTDTKRGRRGGRSPWQLLGAWVDGGDQRAGQLWRQWEQETKGHQALTWSRGLKQLLGVAEQSDEDAAADPPAVVELRELTGREWRAVTRYRGGLAWLLQAAEHSVGRFDAVLRAMLRAYEAREWDLCDRLRYSRRRQAAERRAGRAA